MVVIFSIISTIQKINAQSGDLNSFIKNFYSIDSKAKPEINAEVDYLNIFFLDGNCSFCIAEMYETEKIFKRLKNDKIFSLFIVETIDTMYFNFFKDKFQIQSLVLWDKDNYMKGTFIDLGSRDFFLLNSRNEVLIRGDILNNIDLKKRYFKIVNGGKNEQ